MAATPRVKVPEEVKKGEVFEIKTLIPHQMESGQRKDKAGKVIPRMIINKFVCKYNGDVIFSVDLQPAISANPYFSFYAVATDSGELEFTWVDDQGKVYKTTAKIKVTS
jgi:sulfur-oxidizing protein SoxZ